MSYTTFDKLPIGAIFTRIGTIHPFTNYVYQKIKQSSEKNTYNVICLSTNSRLCFNTDKLKKTFVTQL